MVQHKSVAIIRQMFQSQNTNLLLNFHHLIIWSVWIFGLASYQLLTGEILPRLCCCHFLVCMFCDGIIWSVSISALASYQLLTGEILHWKEDSLSSSGPPTPTQLFRSSPSSSWSLLSTQHHPDVMSESLHITWKQIHIRSSNSTSTSTSLMTYLHWYRPSWE